MRDDGRDIYDIRKQVQLLIQFIFLFFTAGITTHCTLNRKEEVLAESYMMIPDSNGRLESAMQVLASQIEVLISKYLQVLYGLTLSDIYF
jgi:hypothetical protein